MGQKLKITLSILTTDGGEETVVAGQADFIKFERKYGLGAIEAMQMGEKGRTEWFAFLAWSALRRTRPGVPEFDQWIDTSMLEAMPAEEQEGKDPADPLT
jgi:hypothetical protein